MRGGSQLRANELQTTGRRRRRTGSRTVFLVIAVIFAVLLFYIRDIKVRMKEVQETLERLEQMQIGGYGVEGSGGLADTSHAGGEGGGEGRSGAKGVGSGEGFSDTVPGKQTERIKGDGAHLGVSEAAAYVSRPVERTLIEALYRLEELAGENETIAKICADSGLYEEKMLLALANNPEMADFVAGSIESGTAAAGSLTDDETNQDCPLLLQWDRRWGYEPYGDRNIGLSGCGPTCLSMALFALTRDAGETPQKIAAYAMDNGYYVEGTGTAWALMVDYPLRRGVHAEQMQMDEYGLKAALDFGRVLICAMGPGDFTLSGHFIVIYGYDEEGFFVNDPNCIARSREKWTFDMLKGQIKNIWGYWV